MNPEGLIAAIGRLGFAPLLTGDDLDLIRHVATVRRFPRGKVLWRAGSPSRGLYLVLKGEVRVVRAKNGRQYLIHVSGPGASMGEVPLFGAQGYPATAIVSLDAEVLVLPSDDIRALVERNGELASWFLHRLAQRVNGLVMRLEEQTLGGVRMRLAASLIGIAAENLEAVLTLPSPRTQWAEDLGTVREVLAREIRVLEMEGLVERLGTRRLKLLDERRLEAVALGVDSA